MVQMMKNPSILAKAQAEVREAFRDKATFDENDVEELKYLKLVIKETLRLHPPVPLLVPRECREETIINGYTSREDQSHGKCLGRDLSSCLWTLLATILNIFPLAGGRRICPGISFGLANVYLPLAQMLYHFDWKLPTGMEPKDLDLTELVGVAATRKSDLILIATPYQPPRE
ncbi:hypothetical protein P3S67_003270 [Capsicum chacoense]